MLVRKGTISETEMSEEKRGQRWQFIWKIVACLSLALRASRHKGKDRGNCRGHLEATGRIYKTFYIDKLYEMSKEGTNVRPVV